MTLLERWQAFSMRERVLVGVAGALLVGVVGYYAAPDSLEGLSIEGGEDRWAQVQRIENYHRIAARTEALAAQERELQERYQRQQQRLMGGATPTQIGAELQGLLSTAAATAGVNVLSSQILRAEEVEEFRRVGVRMTLSGTLKGVSELLAAVEGHDNDLVVTHLEINRKLGASRRPLQRQGDKTPEQSPLTVSMEVRTFLRSDA